MTFKGKNEIILNQATMCEALDYYFANKIFKDGVQSPKVTKVKEQHTHVGLGDDFIISLDSTIIEPVK